MSTFDAANDVLNELGAIDTPDERWATSTPADDAAPIESSVPSRTEIKARQDKLDHRIRKLANRGLMFGREPNTGNDLLFATRVNLLIDHLLGGEDSPARREFEAKVCDFFATQLDEVEKSAASVLAKSRLIVPGP